MACSGLPMHAFQWVLMAVPKQINGGKTRHTDHPACI